MNDKSRGVWLAIAAVGILLGAAAIITFSDEANAEGYSVKMKPLKGNHPYSFVLTAVWNIPEGVPVNNIEPPAGSEDPDDPWMAPDDGYLGWCVDRWKGLDTSYGTTYDATMWYSYDPDMDFTLYGKDENGDPVEAEPDWNRINYVLNNKGTLSSYQIQHLMWHFSGTGPYPYTSGAVYDMIQQANTYGGDFEPTSSDDVVAWVLFISTSRQTTIIEVPFEPEDDDEPELEDETAWAYGDYTFIAKKIGKNWGWMFDYEVGDYEEDDELKTPFYAGAGRNNIDNGYKAGEIWVWDDGDTLFVKYVLGDGVYMTESHIYVGENFPKKAAPGRFPYKDSDLDYVTELTVEIDLDDFDGDDLIIAVHGVVWS